MLIMLESVVLLEWYPNYCRIHILIHFGLVAQNILFPCVPILLQNQSINNTHCTASFFSFQQRRLEVSSIRGDVPTSVSRAALL
jgi:hypothetical protein